MSSDNVPQCNSELHMAEPSPTDLIALLARYAADGLLEAPQVLAAIGTLAGESEETGGVGVGAAALLAAADWAEAAEGALRAAFIPEADCAIDCAEGALMLWLVSARAWPVCMLAMAACEVDGANEPLAPAALAEF